MPLQRNLLIVIADGEHARFIREAPDHALYTARTLDSASAHQRDSELASDRLGAKMHTGSTAHHAVQPRHALHVLAKQEFAHLLAAETNAAAERGEFNALVIAAPARILPEIRERLSLQARQLLQGTLARDLVKTPDHELQPHLADWVRPVHRAG